MFGLSCSVVEPLRQTINFLLVGIHLCYYTPTARVQQPPAAHCSLLVGRWSFIVGHSSLVIGHGSFVGRRSSSAIMQPVKD